MTDPLQFLIWSWNYGTESGGGIALHRLAHNLAALGHAARLACQRTAPGWLGIPVGPRGLAADSEIVIYPEVVEGNPFQGRRVVRWILNTPGFFGPGNGDGVYGPDDLLMLWSEAYRTPGMAAHRVGGLLTAWRDYSAFKDWGWPRKGVCYAVRKGKNKELDQHPLDALCIDDYAQLGGDDYLIRVFNTNKRFVCYDHASMLPTLAALCGCPSLVIPRINYKPGDARAYALRAGVAWGKDDCGPAMATLCTAHDELNRMIRASESQTAAFVNLCREQWD